MNITYKGIRYNLEHDIDNNNINVHIIENEKITSKYVIDNPFNKLAYYVNDKLIFDVPTIIGCIDIHKEEKEIRYNVDKELYIIILGLIILIILLYITK